jgi:hypothetical protein
MASNLLSDSFTTVALDIGLEGDSVEGTSLLQYGAVTATYTLAVDSVEGTSLLQDGSLFSSSALKGDSVEGTSLLQDGVVTATYTLAVDSVEGTSLLQEGVVDSGVEPPVATAPVWAAAVSQQYLGETGSFVFEPQLIGAEEGNDIFTGFATVPAPWVDNGGGSYSIDGSQSSNTSMSGANGNPQVVGQTYTHTFTCSNVTGDVFAYLWAGTPASPHFVNGVNTYVVEAANNTFICRALVGSTCTIDSYTIKAVQPQPTFNHTTTGSDLLLPDSDGVYRAIPDGNATVHGARVGGGTAGKAILVAAGWVITDGGAA